MPPEQRRDETIQLRATVAEKAMFAQLGGPGWLRDLLAAELRRRRSWP